MCLYSGDPGDPAQARNQDNNPKEQPRHQQRNQTDNNVMEVEDAAASNQQAATVQNLQARKVRFNV